MIAAAAYRPVRRRAARVRDRGRRGDGGREPERAPEDARGAAAVRPPRPDQLRAGGAARHGACRGASRSASGRSRPRRSRGCSRSGAAEHSPEAGVPPLACAAAMRPGPPFCSPTPDVSFATRPSAASGRRAPRELGSLAVAGRCSRPPRRRARRLRARLRIGSPSARRRCGSAARRRGRARRTKRAAAPGAARRTEVLDLALALVGAWFRDLAAVAEGAPETASERRPRRGARAPTPRASTRAPRAPRPSSCSTPAGDSGSTSPRSSCSRRRSIAPFAAGLALSRRLLLRDASWRQRCVRRIGQSRLGAGSGCGCG